MRIGLVVDATCDLPPEFLAAHGIRVMPIGIRLGEQRLIDRRDPDTTLSFYRDHLPKVGSKDGSQPLSAAELQQWFLDELVTDFDYVVCLTVDSLRSPIFEHATQASFGLLQHYHERRHAAGIAGPFTLRVLDSHSVFAGIACLAAEGTPAGAGQPPQRAAHAPRTAQPADLHLPGRRRPGPLAPARLPEGRSQRFRRPGQGRGAGVGLAARRQAGVQPGRWRGQTGGALAELREIGGEAVRLCPGAGTGG